VSVCHSPFRPYSEPASPTTSCAQRARAITRAEFRLFPVRFPTLWIQIGMSRHDAGRVTPFGYPRITAC
jgi:hypothetical protein